MRTGYTKDGEVRYMLTVDEYNDLKKQQIVYKDRVVKEKAKWDSFDVMGIVSMSTFFVLGLIAFVGLIYSIMCGA